MSTYLTAFRQTSDTWAKLIANPEDRRETLAPVFEAAGGKLLGYWYASARSTATRCSRRRTMWPRRRYSSKLAQVAR